MKRANTRLYLDVLVGITTLFSALCLLEDRKHATNTTTMNPKYNIYNITEFLHYTAGNFSITCYALDMNGKELCMKLMILIDCEEANDGSYSKHGFKIIQRNSQR